MLIPLSAQGLSPPCSHPAGWAGILQITFLFSQRIGARASELTSDGSVMDNGFQYSLFFQQLFPLDFCQDSMREGIGWLPLSLPRSLPPSLLPSLLLSLPPSLSSLYWGWGARNEVDQFPAEESKGFPNASVSTLYPPAPSYHTVSFIVLIITWHFLEDLFTYSFTCLLPIFPH